MAIKLRVKSVDGLDETTQKLYKKDGEGFILDLDSEIPDVSGLKTALTEEREKVSGLRSDLDKVNKSLKKFDNIDIDRIKELEALEEDIKTKSKGWEKMAAQLNDTHAEETKGLHGQIKVLTSTLEDTMISQAATMEIEKSGGSPLLLLPVIKQEARLVEENGKHHVRLFKGDDPMIDDQGSYLTLAGRIAKLKESEGYGGAFKGSGATGGGTDPGSGGGGGGGAPNKGLDRATMTTKDKNLYMDKHGVEKYNELPLTLPSQRKKEGDAVTIIPQ